MPELGFHQLAWVPLVKLRIDETYQRPPAQVIINAVAESFDPDVFGLVTVARRPDKSLWIIDGAQRVRALRRLPSPPVKVPACLMDSTGPEWEAGKFIKLDTRKKLTAYDRYRASYVHRESWAVRVAEALEEHGYQLANSSRTNRAPVGVLVLGCAGELTAIAKNDEEAPAQVLALLRGVFDNDPYQVDSRLVSAVGYLVTQVEDVRLDVLQAALRGMGAASTTDTLMREGGKQYDGGGKRISMGKALQLRYEAAARRPLRRAA